MNETPNNVFTGNVTQGKAVVHQAGQVNSRTAEQNAGAVSRLHAELDGIITRDIGDRECREALLDCLVRCRSLTGGIWYDVNNEFANADVVRLQGATFEREEVRRWLGSLAGRAIADKNDVVASCPHVRGLQAACVPVAADRRSEARNASTQESAYGAFGSRDIDYPNLVLVAVTSGKSAIAVDAELLAAQCVVRAWRNWFAKSQASLARTQLHATSALLELANKVASAGSTKEACQTLANALQQHFDAKYVAVGLNSASRNLASLVCVSGIGDFDPEAQQTARLESALNESIVRNSVTSYPVIDASDAHQNVAHRRAAETTGAESLVSVPLIDNDSKTIGALTIGGSAPQLLSHQTKNILVAASQPIGAAIAIAETIQGGRIQRTIHRVSEAARSARGKLIAAAVGASLLSLCIPMPYRIGCRCKAEPVLRRYSLAPYDGLVENTFAKPGDRVSQGDLMAKMKGSELSWELAGVTADAQRAGKERDVNMAELKIADSLMSEMQMEKLKARELLLQNRLGNLELRSPIDGIVLSGSLDRRENYPVNVGQVLYEIAPIDPIRLEVAVPADELMHVAKGMTVDVRLDGENGGEIAGTISRIHPRSEARDDQNVFVAEVVVPNPNGDIKPGMEGAARITSRRHAIGWNIGHHAWERLMTRVWW